MNSFRILTQVAALGLVIQGSAYSFHPVNALAPDLMDESGSDAASLVTEEPLVADDSTETTIEDPTITPLPESETSSETSEEEMATEDDIASLPEEELPSTETPVEEVTPTPVPEEEEVTDLTATDTSETLENQESESEVDAPDATTQTEEDLVETEETATIVSFSVPADLSFELNPNLESGAQFVAPGFEITNTSDVPLTLSLSGFSQTSNCIQDVLGGAYTTEGWSQLGISNSKQWAIALQPLSGNWLTQTQQEPLYAKTVQESAGAIELGTISPQQPVSFEFIAKHGLAFNQPLTPTYHLTFVFNLLTD